MDASYSLIQTFIRTILSSLMLSIFMQPALASGTSSEQVENIKIAFSNLQDVKADFDAARNRSELDATAQSDYRAWIRQLSDQLARDCAALTQEEQAALSDDQPCETLLTSSLRPANINLANEQTKSEQTNGLLDELNASMGEFDERLLQEQARVKAQVPHTENTSGEVGGGRTGQPNAEGEAQSTDTATTTGQDPDQSMEGISDATMEQPEGEREKTVSEPGAQGTARTGSDNDVPENIPDGSDDDVVARQLREAAEKETDPELKKKLWEEYRRYKEGTG